jgi:hypothetical protein
MARDESSRERALHGTGRVESGARSSWHGTSRVGSVLFMARDESGTGMQKMMNQRVEHGNDQTRNQPYTDTQALRQGLRIQTML